jgi:hypothetical protein
MRAPSIGRVVECTIGRVTTLDPRGDVRDGPDRPPRPVLVELASAILIIGSFMDGAISFEAMMEATTQETRLFATASVLVAAGLIALGVMIRGGRLWLLALNVVALAAFLELQTVTPGGVFAALIYMVVVGILLRERAWFHWVPEVMPDA